MEGQLVANLLVAVAVPLGKVEAAVAPQVAVQRMAAEAAPLCLAAWRQQRASGRPAELPYQLGVKPHVAPG